MIRFYVIIDWLHHVPLKEVLLKAKKALRANGTLVVLDLFRGEGLEDTVRTLLAIPPNTIMQIVKDGPGRLFSRPSVVWQEHFERDVYLKVSEVRIICASVLPGARIQKHLYWRYSIVWRKQEA